LYFIKWIKLHCSRGKDVCYWILISIVLLSLIICSQIDLCHYMVNYPDLISLPVQSCPIPVATYNFNVKMSFNEPWLDINGDMQVIPWFLKIVLVLCNDGFVLIFV
jgi:hypothetical protein